MAYVRLSPRGVLLSATALGALGFGSPAFSQTESSAPATQNAGPDSATSADEAEPEAIVVTGIRASQRASIDIKRDSVSVVDSIVATDLGKLPDQNVAESLQRIAGVTIERNRGEGRYVTVRGFGPKFNAVTVNGRTLATDNNGREFSFDVLPSELISGADVYKSPQANLNGVSIGATVDVRTLRPLDGKAGLTIAGSGSIEYAEMADRYNPEVSGVLSWRNRSKTFGISLAAVHSNQHMRDDEFTIGAGHVRRSSGDSYYALNGVKSGRIGPNVAPFTNVSMPSNLSPFFFERHLTRSGVSGSIQARPIDNLTITLDGLYSKARFIEQQTGLAYDFSGGILTDQVVQNGEAVYQAYKGGFVDEIIQYDDRNVTTDQFGANVAWNATDNFKLTFDASHSDAKRRGRANDLFTTVRRKNVDLFFDRRSGSPLYSYGFTSPNYANAATNPNGLTAHYYIWGGGTDVDDSISEYRTDAEWKPNSALTLSAGGFIGNRKKTLIGNSTPFGEQCTYCDSNVALPSSLFSPTNRDFFQGGGGNIIHDWIIYNPQQLIAFIDQRAAADGKPFNPGTVDPSASSVVDEHVKSGYLMGNFDTSLGGMPLAINVGLRFEDTQYTSSGASKTVLSAKPNGGGQNIIVVSPVVPVSFKGHYRDWLPSLNLRLSLTDNLILRLAASKVITRPTLSDLSPKQSIQTNPGNEAIRQGNPDLQPFRAKQVEAGLEWYMARDSLLNFSAFYKKIDSFVTLVTTPQKVDEVVFQVTVPDNGKGATVKGFELGYRQAFTFLPGPFDGLGVQTSFNYTDSNAHYTNTVANVSYGLEGLSKYSYSLVGFYEKYGVQARVAYTWRDNFLQVASGRNGEPEYFSDYGQLDASLSYDVTPNFSVFANAVNLNNAKEFIYSVSEDRTKEYRKTGRRVSAGVRIRL